MGKYRKEVIDDLLNNLDGLDVLEFIDYHPESIQREGNIVTAFCPLSQNRTDRYLTVDLETGEFRSDPPDMPLQSGNLVDLYARVKRIDLDQAVEDLADEFGILVVDDDGSRDPEEVMAEAEELLAKAEKEGPDTVPLLEEAEKRFSRIVHQEPKNIKALEGIQRIRVVEENPLTLFQATVALIKALKGEKDEEKVVEAARRHLKIVPEDLPVREELSGALARLGRMDEAAEEYLASARRAEQSNDIDEALKCYRQMRQAVPERHDVHGMIVELLNRQGREEEARAEVLEEFRRLKTEGDFDRAAALAEEVLALDEENGNVRLAMVELAIQTGLDEDRTNKALAYVDEMVSAKNDAEASEALSLLLSEKPENPDVLTRTISVYRRLGESDVAEELELRLADILREKGRLDEALSLLESRLAKMPDDLRAKLQIGRVLGAKGQKDVAIGQLREVEEMALQMMEEERALEAIQAVCHIDPGQLEEREREVEMLWALGRHEDARERLGALVADLEADEENDRLIRFLESHLNRDPDHLAAIKALSRAYERLGEERKSGEIRTSAVVRLMEQNALQSAEEAILDFLKSAPDDTVLLEKLTDLYGQQKRTDDVRRVLLDLEAAHGKAGNHEERCQVLLGLADRCPNDMEILDRLFEASTLAGDEGVLVDTLQRQIELLVVGSDFKGALEKARAILDRQSGHEGALKALVKIYEKLGRTEDAIETARRLAARYRDLGENEDERKLVEMLVRQDPGQRESRERLVELFAMEKREKETLDQLREYQDRHGKDTERVLGLMKRALGYFPELMPLRLQLIRQLKALKREDDMVAELQAAVEILEGQHEHEKLVELYLELIRVRPDNLLARARLVDLMRQMGRAKQSVVQNLELAKLYREARNLKEAAAAYQKMETEDPGNEAVLVAHAELLREMGKPEAASRKMRQLAAALAEQGRVERAVDLLRGALSRNPGDMELRQTMIELLRNAQQFDQASAELKGLADGLAESGDLKGAVAALREAVAMAPESIETREALVAVLEKSGRGEEAEAERVQLAETLTNLGQPQRAMAVTDAILEQSPSNLAARRLRARIFDSLGDEKKALSEYREMQNYLDKTPASLQSMDRGSGLDEAGAFFPGLQIMAEYHFESFVVGSKNNFAYATAKAVADHPGSVHNPLFLYSDVGLGKTHLLHAIANKLKEDRPDIQILYASTEYFTSALIEAIQNNSVTAFRNRHRRSDVLLLDDVQFLAGKERSQEEFFHIFNILHQDGRQIVVTSDRPPKDIAHLDKRIRSRFGQGVIVDIQPPDLETRIAILRAEAERRGVTVDHEAMAVIAERVTSNIRELKGAFNQLMTQHELMGDDLNAATAQSIVEKFFVS